MAKKMRRLGLGIFLKIASRRCEPPSANWLDQAGVIIAHVVMA
jgi:hypothetical protein